MSTSPENDTPDLQPSAGRSSPTGIDPTFLLLIALGLLYYLAFEHTQWRYDSAGMTAPVPLVPIPPVLWYTICWLALLGIFWGLMIREAPVSPTDDRSVRRAVILGVAAAYGFETYSRLSTVGVYGLEQRVGSGAIITVVAALVVVLGLLVWKPLPSKVLIAGMLFGGTAIRILFLAAVKVNAGYADNLSGISLGLDRLLTGQTPYTMLDYGTHVNPMGYLPWTLMAYLPPKALGIDLRVTNVVLTLAVLATVWLFLRALPLPPHVRSSLLLVLGLFYLLPKNVGNDAFSEFQTFNLAMVSALCLTALRRERLGAAGYGIALGAMPLALFFAPALLAAALRTRPVRRVIEIVVIAGLVGGVPVLVFALWDWRAFLQATTSLPQDSWTMLERFRGDFNVYAPQYALWHSALGASLRFVDVALALVACIVAATRVRGLRGAVGIGAATYLSLVVFGPLVEPHMLQLVLYLAIILVALTFVPDGTRTS